MSFEIVPSNTFRDDLKENQEAAIFMLKSCIFVLQDQKKQNKQKYIELCRKYFHFEKDDTEQKMLSVVKLIQSIFLPILTEMVKYKNLKVQN